MSENSTEDDALAAVLRQHRADGWVCTCGWPLTDSVGSVVDHLAEQIEPLIAVREAEAWERGNNDGLTFAAAPQKSLLTNPYRAAALDPEGKS